MRHVVKYLLVLAMLMSGFYMARMFRVPHSAGVGVETPAENGPSDLPTLGEGLDAQVGSDGLPAAALADVDKTSVAVVEDLAEFGSREPADRTGADSGQWPLSGQPTVRKQGESKRHRSQSDEQPRRGARYNGDQRQAEPMHSSDSFSPDRDLTDERSGDSWGRLDSETESTLDNQQSESVGSYGSPKKTRRSATYDNAVPEFAADYKPWLDPLEESVQPYAKPVETFEHSDSLGEANRGDRQKEHDHVVRHRIVEGDTLRHLAERYLGDRDRYLDLYEANSDVLFHPRLLPIGIEIVIPEPPNMLLADEDEDSDDLTAQNSLWGDADDTQSDADAAYSPWGEY